MEPIRIQVCTGPKCRSLFSEYIIRRLRADLDRSGRMDNVIIETCGCMGNCKSSPNILIDGVLHTKVNPVIASELLMKKL